MEISLQYNLAVFQLCKSNLILISFSPVKINLDLKHYVHTFSKKNIVLSIAESKTGRFERLTESLTD